MRRAAFDIRAAAHIFFAFPQERQAGGIEASRENLNRQAEQILNEWGSHILRLAYSYLQSRSDAEDVLQDTLPQFLKAAPAFESEEHKKTWLLRVEGNISKNRIAYNRVHSTDELEESLAAEHRKDLPFVWETVKALPVKYREVIHLFYYEGYPAAQIADILRISESAVRSRLCRGRAKLERTLGEAYDFAEKIG